MKRCREFMGTVCAAAVVAVSQASAQLPAATTATTNAPDYSQGFQTFLRLGLPDTSQATYIELDFSGPGMYGTRYFYALREAGMKGDAWLLSGDNAATNRFLTAAGAVLELAADQVTPRREGVPSAKWKPRDLQRDLAKATDYVKRKLAAKTAGKDEWRYDSFSRSDEGVGALFLLAVCAWQHGRQAEANALAGALFAFVGDSRKVILGAVNTMADAQLEATEQVFRTTRDWNAYAEAVAVLLRRYPAGWRNAPAARLLQERLQERAALAAVPPLTTAGLDDEYRSLAAALATWEPERSYSGMETLWFLTATNRLPPEKETRQNAVARIQTRGLRSIPLLLALAGDTTLCPLFRDEVGMPTYGNIRVEGSSQGEEEMARFVYSRMSRPQTRGEIALHLLGPLAPSEESERRGGSDERLPEEIAAAAGEAYAAIKDLPHENRILYFLKNGDETQKGAAAQMMMKGDIASHATAIEEYLLIMPDDARYRLWGRSDNGMVKKYVELRGTQATNFVDRYEAMLRKIELPAGMDSEEFADQFRKGIDDEVSALRALTRVPDLSGTIAAITNAAGDDQGWMYEAYQTLQRLPSDAASPALLQAAAGNTNAAARARLMQMLSMLGRQQNDDMEMEEDGPEVATPDESPTALTLIGTNAAVWKILLADKRPAEGSYGSFGVEIDMTVADMAALGMESLYGSLTKKARFWRSFGTLPPDVALSVFRRRAEARLAGTPENGLPQMPSVDDVTTERRVALAAALKQAAAADLPPLLDGLSPAETLWLAEVVDEDASLAAVLAAPSRRIVTVAIDPALEEPAAHLLKLQGTALGTNAVAAMRDYCRKQLAAGKALSVGLSSSGLAKGLSLKVDPVTGDDAHGALLASGFGAVNRKGGKPTGMVTGMLRGGSEGYGHGMWLVELAPGVVPEAAAVEKAAGEGEDDDEDEDDDEVEVEVLLDGMESHFEAQNNAFDEAVAAFCQGTGPLQGNATITFTGMLP